MRVALKIFLSFTALALLAPSMALAKVHGPALREAPRHEDEGPRPAQHWHGDIHQFHDRDLPLWRSGRWVHGLHGGRTGWWWVAGGFWYFYPAPVYPYPDPYVPPTVIVEPAPAAMATYYYCERPEGYYPYIIECASMWQKVLAPVAPAVAVPDPGAAIRDADFGQLNIYADEFRRIDVNAPNAGGKLRSLSRRLDSFRKTLLNKPYDTKGILQDSGDLRARIQTQRDLLRKPRAKVVAPPPATLPPGAPVQFED